MEKSSANPDELKDKARRYVNFKIHFVVFILALVLFWGLAFFLNYAFEISIIWAIFPSLFWAVILLFHYLRVYKWNSGQVEREYQKLLKKQLKSATSEPKDTDNQEFNQ